MRALLRIIGIVTVHQLGAGVSQPRRATLDVIRRALKDRRRRVHRRELRRAWSAPPEAAKGREPQIDACARAH